MPSHKKKAVAKKAPAAHKTSPVIQFGVVFIILAAMALVAFAYKNYM